MRWLLDTNAWIHVLKPGGRVIAERLAACLDRDVALCSVVKAELWFGAHRYTNRIDRLARLTELFARHISLPFDDAAAEQYGGLRHQLASTGAIIGPNDLMIAAICLTHDVTLVTSNVSEFSRVPGLKLDNWHVPEQETQRRE